MSAATEWVELVDEVAAQEPPRFQGTVITQARVAPNGSMRLQLQGTAIEVPAAEGIALAQWIADTFGPLPPVLTSLVPSTAVVGGATFVLHIHGTGFTAECVVFANGTQRPTTVVSATELTVQTTPISNPQTVTIEVSVGPTGPRSNALSFTYTAA